MGKTCMRSALVFIRSYAHRGKRMVVTENEKGESGLLNEADDAQLQWCGTVCISTVICVSQIHYIQLSYSVSFLAYTCI